MKNYTLILAGIFAATFFIALPANAAGNSGLKLHILPIDCVFEIVNDGNNTINYITPEECGQVIGSPSPGPPFGPPPHGPPFDPPQGGPPSFVLPRPNVPGSSAQSTIYPLSTTDEPVFGIIGPDGNPITVAGVCGASTRNYLNPNREQEQMKLSIGRSLCFGVQNDDVVESHTVTLKEIGSDYVVIIIASEPTEIHLGLGQTKQHDTNDNGIDDIEITLNAILANQADVTFKVLSKPEIVNPPSSQESANGPAVWLYGLYGAAALVVLAATTRLLAVKYRADKP